MSDLRDFTGKNRIFTGTDAETITSGTTAQRVDGDGKLRFNTTTNLMEYYDGTDWKAIDAPPVVTGFTVDDVGGSSVTSATVDNEKTADSGNFTIEILGSLFDTTGATVQFIATAGNTETINTQSITRNSANKLTVTVDASDFDVANSPYTIKVTNGSGLSANLEESISADSDAPTFTNSADTNVDIFDSLRGSGTIAAADLIGASGVKASAGYAVTTGSLPSGFTLNTTSGDITYSSVSAVGSDTQTLFTITATSTEGGTTARQFGITVKAPVTNTFTSTGAFTYSVPTGASAVRVLVVAGGGSGGSQVGGGGGAGGMVTAPAYPVTPGGSISGSVGAGAPRAPFPSTKGTNGSNSTFGTITAYGGGGGGRHQGPGSGKPGGSGGGGGDTSPGGSATQTSFSPVGATGYGNAGGNGTPSGPGWNGGGGGGAGGAGSNHSGSNGGPGGIGRQDNITGTNTYYAGGGGGCTENGSGGSGGNGGGGNGGNNTGQGQSGTNGLGGGGGGSRDAPTPSSGAGGSGIVIVSL